MKIHQVLRISTNKKLGLFLANLLTVVITLAICFVILEYGLARYYHTDIDEKKYKEFDPELGWINKAGNHSIKPRQSLVMNSFYINKEGLRNRDISPKKNNAVQRIVILGDSFTFAAGVGNQDIFPTQIESILNRSLPNYKYEVINAGVEGYGNIQELLLMKRLAARDIVGNTYILMLFVNDILDNLCLTYDDVGENLVQPKYDVDTNNKLVLIRAPKKIIDDSSNLTSVKEKKRTMLLFDTLKTRLQSFLQSRPDLISLVNRIGVDAKFRRMPGLLAGWYSADVLNRGIPVLKQCVKEIQSEAERLNARLYVSLIPSPLQVYPDTYGPLLQKTFPASAMVDIWFRDKLVPQRVVGEICEELDIPFCDLYPVLYKNNDRELFIPNDGHFSKEAHTIVAGSLATFVLSHRTSGAGL